MSENAENDTRLPGSFIAKVDQASAANLTLAELVGQFYGNLVDKQGIPSDIAGELTVTLLTFMLYTPTDEDLYDEEEA